MTVGSFGLPAGRWRSFWNFAPQRAAAPAKPDEFATTVAEASALLDFLLRERERVPDQIIEDIGNEKCRILVTGYSSTQGSHATNALFAVERAQNVLAYLRQNGLQYEKATAVGGGGTTQFGDDFAANRRVVITVTP